MRDTTTQPFDEEQLRRLKKTDQLFQHFKEVNQQRKGIQFFNLISSNPSKVVFLDQQKQFAIVQVKYLQQLKASANKVEEKLKEISQQLVNQHITKEMFSRIVEGMDREIQGLMDKIGMLEDNIKLLEKLVKKGEDLVTDKEEEIQALMEKHERQLQDIHTRRHEETLRTVLGRQDKKQTEVQTQFDQFINQISLQKNGQHMNPTHPLPVHNRNIEQSTHNEIQALKRNFQQALRKMSDSLDSKLHEMEQQKLSVEEYRKENFSLRQQNQRLKQEIVHRNEQEYKLSVWRSSLENYIQNIQKSHQGEPENNSHIPNMPSFEPEPNGQHNYLTQEKIRILQSTIDKMLLERRLRQRKAEEIKAIIDEAVDAGSVSEENIVGSLLGLSGKLKEVVRFLLTDI